MIAKTEKEIREEIEAARRTIENYRKEYKAGSLPKQNFKNVLIENHSVINALKWVLGENDRYD